MKLHKVVRECIEQAIAGVASGEAEEGRVEVTLDNDDTIEIVVRKKNGDEENE